MSASRSPRPGARVRGSSTGRPIMAALDLFGRRWSLRLLWELRDGPIGARALVERCGGVSTSVLYERLRELADASLVTQDCLIITTVTGIAYYGIEDGAGPLAMLAGSPGWARELLEEVHELFANLMVLLVVVHIVGVILESRLHHENLVKSMFNGRKRA